MVYISDVVVNVSKRSCVSLTICSGCISARTKTSENKTQKIAVEVKRLSEKPSQTLKGRRNSPEELGVGRSNFDDTGRERLVFYKGRRSLKLGSLDQPAGDPGGTRCPLGRYHQTESRQSLATHGSSASIHDEADQESLREKNVTMIFEERDKNYYKEIYITLPWT